MDYVTIQFHKVEGYLKKWSNIYDNISRRKAIYNSVCIACCSAYIVKLKASV